MKSKIKFILAVIFFTTGTVPAAVISFTLINANTDKDIQTITNGDTINLSAIPTLNINIRANVDKTPKNVSITLSGASSHSNTESFAPYALWGDKSGDYNAGSLKVGVYILSAKPAGGSTYQIKFKVIYSPSGVPMILGAKKETHAERYQKS